MTDHEKRIREALEAGPTDGPWVHNKQGYPKSDVRAAGDGGRNIANTWGTAASQAKTPEAYKARTDQDRLNAAYIAACNPSAIRALLADLDAMRGALKRIACIQNKMFGEDWEEIEDAREIASAALKGASA